MYCPRCGCNASGTDRICVGCGGDLKALLRGAANPRPYVVASPEQFVPQAIGVTMAMETCEYATMEERFLAFLCDTCVASLLMVAALTVLVPKSSLTFERLNEIAVWIIPPAYMTLAEFFFHGTIGKRLLRIKLQTDADQPGEPSFFRLLLREAVGKPLSSAILGIGFLVALGSPKKKTWADQMAKTVVVRMGMRNRFVKALLVPLLICAYFSVAIAIKEMPKTYEKNLLTQLTGNEDRIHALHEQILKSIFTVAPKSLSEYQQTLSSLAPVVSEYKGALAEKQDLMQQTFKLLKPGDGGRTIQYLAIAKDVLQLRREIASLVSNHIQMVLSHKQTWEQVLQDRKQMLDEVGSRNDRIIEITEAYTPRKTRLDSDSTGGLLYRALDREWGGWHAVIGSAAFFAIYHPVVAWLPVSLLGVANALVFKKTGRLVPAVILHMVYNAVVLS